MRLKLSFHIPPHSKIPINYNYYLTSAIYRAIKKADSEFSMELHSSEVPKLFTFSKLMIPNRKIVGDKIIIESENAYFFFSSLRNEIAQKLVEGFFARPEIKLGNLKLSLSQVEILEERKIRGRETFITLSPVYVSKDKNGEIVDLRPEDREFCEILKKNLIKKYKIFHGREPENKEIEIRIIKPKEKRIFVKKSKLCSFEMVFEAKGNPELLEIGYKAGFGAKNSMGFGMVKVVKPEEISKNIAKFF